MVFGPNFGTGSDDASVGTVAWSNPTAVSASDDTYATATLPNNQTHYLKVLGFGFAIPANQTIEGILVSVERHNDMANYADDLVVKLVKAGVVGGTNYASGLSWPASDEIAPYPHVDFQHSLWGQTWTPADINDPNFGVVISCAGGSGQTDSIDSVSITIYTPLGTTLLGPQGTGSFAAFMG